MPAQPSVETTQQVWEAHGPRGTDALPRPLAGRHGVSGGAYEGDFRFLALWKEAAGHAV